MRARLPVCLAATVLLVAACPAPPVARPPRATAGAAEVRFCLHEGAGHNCLLRDATVAAHVLATSGRRARLVVAFPVENSGAAFWADAAGGRDARLELEEPMESFREGPLRGVRFKSFRRLPRKGWAPVAKKMHQRSQGIEIGGLSGRLAP